jgi:hypothetical protein
MINYLSNFAFQNQTNGITAPITTPCMDQIVGQLTNGSYMACNQRIDIDYQQTSNQKFIVNAVTSPIIVILESPHRYEYINGVAVGPAQNTTGRLFNNHFSNLLSQSTVFKYIANGCHDVIMINSVQYQCSLGNPLNIHANKIIRDQVWNNCFNNGCSQDLLDRISAINPSCIINLCTKGLINLQLILHTQISHLPNYTYGTHPSTWNFSYAYIN